MCLRKFSNLLVCSVTFIFLLFSNTANSTCTPDPYAGVYESTSFLIICQAEGDPRVDPVAYDWVDVWLDDPAYAYYDARYDIYRSAYWVPYLGWGGYANNSTIYITPDSNVTAGVSVGPVWGGNNTIYNSSKMGGGISAYGYDNYVLNTGYTTKIEGGEGSTLINEGFLGSYNKNVTMFRDDTFGAVIVSVNFISYDTGMEALASSDIINRGLINMTYGGTTKGIAIADESTATNETTGSIFVAGIDSTGMYGVGDHTGVMLSNQGTIGTQAEVSEGISVLGDAIMENSGTINAGGDGSIGMKLVGHAGEINNSGSINATGIGNEGISATLGSVGESYLTTISITNDGDVLMQGDQSEGIHAAGFEGAIVTNNGSVDASGIGVEGISVLGRQATVLNSATGNIKVAGSGAVGISLQGDGIVTNVGTIRAEGVAAEGISASSGAAGNSVTVHQDGSITATEAQALGISLVGDNIVVNTGTTSTISMLGSDANGIGLLGDRGSITNRGEIQVQQATSNGIGVEGDAAIVLNETSGTVHAAGQGSRGVGVLGSSGTIVNKHLVLAEGPMSVGLGIQGDNATIINSDTARVDVVELDSVGIGVSGDNAIVNNEGIVFSQSSRSPAVDIEGGDAFVTTGLYSGITTAGVDSPGIWITGNFPEIMNRNLIETTNDRSPGIIIDGLGLVPVSSPDITNEGTISTGGDSAPGVVAIGGTHYIHNEVFSFISTIGSSSDGIRIEGDDSRVTNSGSITTAQSNAGGIYGIGNSLFLENTTTGFIKTQGDDAIGIQAGSAVSGMSESAKIISVGSIETEGDRAHGIFAIATAAIPGGLEPPAGDRSVNSAGTIKTQGDDAVGIFIEGSDWYINNAAKITTQGYQSYGISVMADGSILDTSGEINTFGQYAHGINVAGQAMAINNSGKIETYETGAYGINVEGDDHTVRNIGSITTNRAATPGINVLGDRAQIINLGPVTVVAPLLETPAVFLHTATGQTSTLINSGTLTGANRGGVEGWDGDDTVENSGTINGNVRLQGGNDSLVVKDGSVITGTAEGGAGTNDNLVAEFAGNQTLDGDRYTQFENFTNKGTGKTTLDGSLKVNKATLTAGQLALNGTLETDSAGITNSKLEILPSGLLKANDFVNIGDGGTIDLQDGEVQVQNMVEVMPGGRLVGIGTIDKDKISNLGGYVFVNWGEILPGHSTGTLTIAGNLDFSGKMEFEANSLFDTDHLIIGGDATLAGGYLDVVLGFTPDSGDVLDFLIVQGSVNILEGFGGIRGIAAAGSGVELGTQFNVNLGGQLFTGTVTSVVPIPPAVWLFGSGLLGLVAVSRRKRRT